MEDSKFSKIFSKAKKRAGVALSAVVALVFLINTADEIKKSINDLKDKKEKNKITKTKTHDSNPQRNIASASTPYNPYEKAQRNSYSGGTSSDNSYREAVTVTQEPEINLTKSRSIAEAIENKKAAEVEKASTQRKKESSTNDKKTKSSEQKTTEKASDVSDVIEQTNVGYPTVNVQEDTQTNNTTESETSTQPPVITPEIVSIISTSPGDGTYTTGEVFDIIVTFDEAVTTTSSSLTLSNGGTATYLSGTGTTAITYQYTAAGGEDTNDLNVSIFNIEDAVSSSSTAPSGTLTTGQNLADNQAIIIDTTAPSIVSISSPATNGRYTNTNTIDITVTFDEIINLTSSSLTLDTGETATYSGGSGSTTLTYQYTVGAGVNSADLTVTGFNPGDAIDVVSIAPNTTLPASTNLANNKDIVIDNQAASIVNITGTNGTYTNTDTVDIVVTFDEAVNTSTSTLSLDTGATAIYESGSGTTAITYRYTVGGAENSSDLTVSSFNIGNATDLVGIAVNTTIPGGQNLDDLHDVIIDNTAALITNITSSKTDAIYPIGEIIDIDVTFNEIITAGTSSLTLDTTGSAVYQSGSGTNTITYRYTVGAGENTSDLNVSAFNAGSAEDPAGITPDATLPSGGVGAGNLSTNKAIVIDTNQATIVNIESTTPDDGTYNAGDTIEIIVTFNEAITTSTSSLTLDTGGTATYDSGSTTSSITYSYTVLATHTSSDLNVTAFNVGDAIDGVSLAPSTTLPTGIAGAGNLATNNDIIIDTTAPTVTAVSSPDGDGPYGIGDTVDIHVDFSENVIVTGTPQITLNSGAVVDYTSGSGSSTLVFTYTVAITEASSDLDYVNTSSLTLNSGTILDTGDNLADLTLVTPGSLNSISDNQEIVIDGVVPTITDVSSNNSNGTYGETQVIDIRITFSEEVNVSGTPTLDLNSSLTASANYFSKQGTNVLIFRYTVSAGENSPSLDYDSISSLNLNAGTIQDVVNNNADLTLPIPSTANSLSNNKNFIIDTTAATITNVTSSNADQTYGVGAVISVQVIFDEVMIVTTGGGTPTLTLETGTTDRDATYASGSGTNTLIFNYTVQAGDSSTDLAYTATTSLALNGGTIQDASTTNADLTLPSPGATNSLSDNKAIVIDTDGASIAQVYSSKGNGTYTVGEVIDIFIEFTELVDVTGTPQLTLDNGAVVNYTSGSNSNTLLFQYTVGLGQNSADLDYAATNSLALNGGTIEDAVNNAATLTLPAPNALNSISDNQAIIIDTQGPQITDIRSTETDGTYGLTQTIDIEITFDENVIVNTGGGTPSLALNSTGSASYVSTASNVITLTYTVGAGEDSTDLDYVNRLTSFVLNGGTIQDALGNNANTVIPVDPGVLNSISDNQAIVVDTSAPTVMQVYASKADGTYGATEVINIHIDFNEPIFVTGTPQITLNSGATVDYTSGSGGGTLVFEYTVGPTDNSTDLDYVNTNSLALNGGIIRDAGLNDAVLTLAIPNASNSISDDQAIVIDTNVASITNITSTKANGVYQGGEVIYIDVTFDELINTSTSTLTLNTGGSTATATYDSQSGTSTIRYVYTVGAGEFTEDLSVTAFNVGNAVDAGGNPPSAGLPIGQNLGDNKNIAIADALLTLNVYVRESTCAASPNPDLCYTSLSSALVNFHTDSALSGSEDLVANNVAVLMHIQDSWSGPETAAVSMSTGLTTDATRNITIQTEGAARHNGTSGSSNHRIQCSGSNCFLIRAGNTIVDGLVVTGPTLTNIAVYINTTQQPSTVVLKNMIIHDIGSAMGIYTAQNNGIELYLQNILAYGLERSFYLAGGSAAVAISNHNTYADHLTIYDVCNSGGHGVFSFRDPHTFSSSVTRVRNSYIGECSSGSGDKVFDLSSGSGSYAGSDYNLLFHDTKIGANSHSNVDLTASAPSSYDGNKYMVVASLTPGSEDFTLVDNAWNMGYSGMDLSASFDPDEDIAGDTITSWHHIGVDWTAKAATTVVNEVYITETDGTTIKPDGPYGLAETMSFIVEFSNAINVSGGNPQITHNASGTPVNCSAHGTLSNALKCDYTVAASDSAVDLDFVNTASLALNGATINDLAGNAVNLTLPAAGGIYSVADDQDIAITAGLVTLDIYVREDCTGAPGQCYTQLGNVFGNLVADTFLTGTNLVTQNTEVIVHIDQAWTIADSSRTSISGWTTDATRFITVQTEGAARHDGTVSGASFYKIDPNTTGNFIDIRTSHTVIDGLILTGAENNSGGQNAFFLAGNPTGIVIKNTIVYDLFTPTSSSSAVYVSSNDLDVRFENILFYGKMSAGISTSNPSDPQDIDISVYNSLIHLTQASARGISYGYGTNPDLSASNFDIRNTAIFTLDDSVGSSGTSSPPTFTGSTSVLTGDDIAQTLLGLDDSNSAIDVLITDAALAPLTYNGNDYYLVNETLQGSEDYHLIDNEFNLALGSGSDLTGTIANDIDGDAITGSSHQIGPDFGSDSSNPIVQNISITEIDGVTLKPDATYGVGETMSFVIRFSQVINTTAGIELDINANSTPLTCVKHTNVWNAIKCDYTVGSGDLSTDLDFDSTTSLSLTTGSIADNYGNNAFLTLPAPGAAYSASNSQAVVIDTVGPVVTNVTSAESNTTYNATEDSLEIQVIFDEPIIVGGSPTLTLETGTTDRVATFDRVDSGNIAIFLYDVLPGDSSSDLDYVATTSLSLNGGTIQDALGNNADLTLAAPGNTNIGSLSHDNNIIIDAVVPTITNIESYSPGDGVYSNGNIDIVVTFDKTIRYGNTSTLTLDNGKTASYQTGLPGMNVTYRYTIGTGGSDDTTDLTVTAFNVGNGEDYSGNIPSTMLPATENLGDNNDIIIDTTAATVTEVRSPTADGTYVVGEDITIEVVFSEAVTVSGTPQLTLDTGAIVNYSSGSTTNILTFTYTVGPGEFSGDLDYANTTALTLNSGSIIDAASNAADLTLAAPNAVNSISDDKAIVISGGSFTVDVYIRPTVGSCAASPDPSLCYTTLSDVDGNIVADSVLPSKDLVAVDANIVVHIQEDWSTAPGGVDASPAVFTGYTTDATHLVTIQTEGVARHNGTANCTTCYRIDPSVSGNGIFIDSENIIIDGIIVTGLEGSYNSGIRVQQGSVTVRNTIVHDLDAGSNNYRGIHFTDQNGTLVLENILIYGEMSYGILVEQVIAPVGSIQIHNSMIVGGTINDYGLGFYASPSSSFAGFNVALVNTAILGNWSQGSIGEAGGVSSPADFSGSTTLITSDDTAQTVVGLDNTNSAINVQVTDAAAAPSSYDGNQYVIVNETLSGSENYHLVDNSLNLALGSGTDLTATIPNDIDGAAITASQHQIGPDFIADSTGPIINEVYLTETDGSTIKPDGTYGNAATMSFIIEFSQKITVTGSPELTHNASATPISCIADPARWNALKCDYTVGASDASLDLDFSSTTALALNGGTISDSAGNAAILTLPAPGTTYSASDDQAVQITAGELVVDVYVRESTCAAGNPVNPPLCYTSLDAAFDNMITDSALIDGDLITQNVNIIVHIQDDWDNADTALVDITGFSTDATHFITIVAEGAARSNGDFSCVGANGCYRMTTAGNSLSIGGDYTVVDGITITDNTSGVGIYLEADEIKLKNIVLSNINAGAANSAAIGAYQINNITAYLENILIEGNTQYGIWVYGSSGVWNNDFIISNTLININHASGSKGMNFWSVSTDFSGSNIDIKNTAFFTGAGGVSIGSHGTPIAMPTYTGSSNILTSDDHAQTVLGLTASNSTINVQLTDAAAAPSSYDGNSYYIVQEMDGASKDFHLVDSSYNFAFSGTDLSAVINPDEDIDGDTISNWYHIGPDWIVDTSAPLIGSITSSKADGVYFNTEVIDIEVRFSEPVNSVISTLTLDTGGTASYISGSGSASHIYRYTVSGSESSSDLTVTSFNANGATDYAGNSLNPTLPATLNLADNKNIAIAAGLLSLDLYVREIATPGVTSCDGSPNPSLCYTSLKTAVDSIVTDTALTSKDLVAQNSVITIHIQEAWSVPDQNVVLISGFTTDASHNITIQTEGLARHAGDSSCAGTCYIMDPNVGDDIIKIGVPDLESDSAYTVVDGIIMTGTESHFSSGVFISADQTRVRNLIMYDFIAPTSNNHGGWGVRVHSDNTETWIENVIMYGDVARFIVITSSTALAVADPIDVHIYNSLFHATNATAGRGILLDDNGAPTSSVNVNLDVQNTAFLGSYVTSIFQNLFTGGPPTFTGSTNILTSDNTAQSVFGLDDTNSAVNVQITDIPPGSYDGNKYLVVNELSSGIEDYHLVDNAFNIAIGGGVDLTASVPNDIDNDAITGTRNQIGPDYLVASNSAPIVNQVYITETDGVTTKPDGTYNPGDSMSFIVEFSKPITVTGTPQLTINNGVSTALDCTQSTVHWAALKCDYTIVAGQSATDLDYLNTSALALNGGTIDDKYGNAALLTLPTVNGLYSASDDQEIDIAISSVVVEITSAPAINSANESAYPISGTCSNDGTANVDLDIGGVTASVNCSGGVFSATLNLSGLAESPITCPADFVLVERNTKYTTEKFCIARYESRNNVGSISLDPTHAVWNSINRADSITQCQSMGGTVDLISNSQWQTVTVNAELNPANWYDGTIGGDGNVFVIGHSDNAPASIETISDIMNPYSNTGNSSSDGATTGWAQRRTHILSSGQEVWDLGGNVLEWVKDDFTSTALNEDAISITATGTFVANAGFADVNDIKDIANQFGPSTDYSGWTLGGTSNAGYLGRIYGGSQAGIIRGGAYFSTDNGIFTAGVDHPPTYINGLRGFRCISQISGGYLAQADHLTAVTDSVTISKDTSIPTAPTLTAPSPASTLTVFDHTFTGTCTAGNIITISGDVVGSPIVRECIGGNYSIEVSFTAGDGVKDVNIDEADLAGNSNSIDESFDIFGTPASIAITSAPTINVNNVATYTVAGTCSPNLSGVIFITTGGVTSAAGNCVAGNFSVTYDVSGVSDGASVSVVADYGKAPSATDSTTVLKDTVAPTDLTVVAGTTTSTRVITQSGNCEVGATVSISGDVEAALGPFTQVCPGGGTYSLDFALSRGAGAKTINIIETDLAGNSTAIPETESYTFNRRSVPASIVSTGGGGTCFIRPADKHVVCSGRNTTGIRGDSSSLVSGTTDVHSLKPIDMSSHNESNTFSKIVVNGDVTIDVHACAIHLNGKVFCWGGNSHGQLGDGTTTKTSTPTEVDMSGNTPSTNLWKEIGLSATDFYTCGIHQTTSELFCWGRNSAGGLGINVAIPGPDVLTPVKVDMSATGYSNSFEHVSIGDGQTCAVHTNGRLFCWGEGAGGRLGINDATGVDYATPQEVDMSSHGLYDNDFIMTSGGDDHMCGLHSSGKIYCWGDDEGATQGILANNDDADIDIPIPTEISMAHVTEENTFKKVKTHIEEGCALHDNGKLFCWGLDRLGSVPIPGMTYADTTDGTDVATEVKMSHLGKANSFIDFTVSQNGMCALHTDGTLYCSGTTARASIPLGAGGSNISELTDTFGWFSPDHVTSASIATWYDSSDVTSLFQNSGCSTPVTANGQSVACWLDKSGNNNTATQSTGSDMPVYNSSLKTVEFDGGNDWLSIGSDVGFPYGTTSRTIFTQATVTDTSPSYQFIFTYGNGGTIDQAVGIGMQDTRCLLSGWGSNFINSAGGCVSLSQSYNMSATFDGSNQDLWRNGTLVESESFAWNTIPSLARIGTQVTAAAEYWNGDISEILLFDDELSASEREKVEGYMACKWGSQGSLPGGHPYSTDCP